MEVGNSKIKKEEVHNNKETRTEESKTEHAAKLSIKTINKISKSICKIIYDDKKYCGGTGFFMLLNDNSKYLITNYHVISKEEIYNNINIELYNHIKIKLDLKILNYKFYEELDITMIDINDIKDIIKNVEFLDYDKNYLKGYEQYINIKLFMLQYPNNDIEVSTGRITEISENKYGFKHNIDTEFGSSGSPIILYKSLKVIGIHKKGDLHEPINYGTFIGEIFKDNIIKDKNDKIKTIKESNNDIIIDSNLNKVNNNEINNINNINSTKNNNINFIKKNSNKIQKALNPSKDNKNIKDIQSNDDKNKNNNFNNYNNNKDNITVDIIIEKLLNVRAFKPGKQVDISENEIKYILDISLNNLKEQKSLLEIETPIQVVGTLNGQYYDLLRIFEHCGYPGDINYLFLGSYVDYGKQSIETMLLLLCYQVKYPTKIFLLRGKEESSVRNRIFGFYEECKRRYNLRIWRSFTELFNYLPFAAIIDDKIFCVHGGLSPELKGPKDIMNIIRPTEIPDKGLLYDLIYSNPDIEVDEYDVNKQENLYNNIDVEDDMGIIFGEKVVDEFLKRNDLDIVIRGGDDPLDDGYEFFSKDRKLISIFSAPNYRGEYDNSAGILLIDENLTISFKVLRPVENLNNN